MSSRLFLLVSLVLVGCICIQAQISAELDSQNQETTTEPTTERDVPMSRGELRDLMNRERERAPMEGRERERERALTPRELQQIRNTLMREYEMAAMTSALYARDLELLEPYLRETQAQVDPDRVMLVEYDTPPDMMLMQEDETSMLESDSDFEVSAPGFGGGYGGFGGSYGGFGGGYGGFGSGGFGGKKGKKIPYKKVPYKKVPYKKVPIKKGGKKGGFGGFGGGGFGGGF